ncbi:MAG TPA: hypothetical protein P5083_00825 [Candidatus Paceibacterota bacterium]|jgi:hypothetical protein|nr:hypothetical protein [Candidatus Pacearchaeota archaeon]HRR94672.1 hypothetical protein [Candidatus Paceibacterota bacterium]HRU20826.1 hypothetical protein [Candidatus Paceibacterota bacterium]
MRPIKKDKFFRDRESTYTILAIGCAKCGKEILLYQKDGRGNLKRLYINRILSPESLASLQDTIKSAKEMEALKCKCGQLIGLPMLHREGRIAFKLIQGNYSKRRYK